MELIAKGTFYRDIAVYTNHNLLQAVFVAMSEIEKAKSISEINNLKKLRKYENQYRLKVFGNYRIGLVIKKQTVWFVRFGHRNIFYKYFP